MTIKITTPNGGADSLDFGCAQTAIVATVTGTEVSSGEGKLEFKTTTGGTSATKATVLANGNVGINKTAPVTKLHIEGGGTSLPATTGTTPSAGTTLRIRPGNNAVLDIGGNGTSGAWIQSYDQTGMQTEYPLLLNPNGGAVTLGTPLAVTSGGTGTTSNAGKVLQVVSATLDTRVSMATTSWQDIGLSATITPSATSSKILITVSFGRAQTTHTAGDYGAAIRLLRGSVDSDLNGVADSNRSRALFTVGGNSYNGDHSKGGYSMTGFDSPSTASAVTYKLQAWPQSSSYPLLINGTASNTDAFHPYTARTKTIITLTEIGG